MQGIKNQRVGSRESAYEYVDTNSYPVRCPRYRGLDPASTLEISRHLANFRNLFRHGFEYYACKLRSGIQLCLNCHLSSLPFFEPL